MKELKKIIYAMLLSVAFIAIMVGAFIVTYKLIVGRTPTFEDVTFGLAVSIIFFLSYGIVEFNSED